MHVMLRLLRDDANPLSTGGYAQADARGQFLMKNLLPGTYEVLATQYLPGPKGAQTLHGRQQAVVTNAAVTNVIVTLESPKARP